MGFRVRVGGIETLIAVFSLSAQLVVFCSNVGVYLVRFVFVYMFFIAKVNIQRVCSCSENVFET